MTNAQKYGAKAILMYSDPNDYAPVRDEDLYPHGWWLPRTGVQRGSILIGTGDPLTPRYPAKGKIRIELDVFTLYMVALSGAQRSVFLKLVHDRPDSFDDLKIYLYEPIYHNLQIW